MTTSGHRQLRHAQARRCPGLAKSPRITPHFTPASGSWLNMTEIFFGIIENLVHTTADLVPLIFPSHSGDEQPGEAAREG